MNQDTTSAATFETPLPSLHHPKVDPFEDLEADAQAAAAEFAKRGIGSPTPSSLPPQPGRATQPEAPKTGPQRSRIITKWPIDLRSPTISGDGAGQYVDFHAPMDWVNVALDCGGKSGSAVLALRHVARMVGSPIKVKVATSVLPNFMLTRQTFNTLLHKFEQRRLVKLSPPDGRQKYIYATILGPFIGHKAGSPDGFFVDGQLLERRDGAGGRAQWFLGDKEWSWKEVKHKGPQAKRGGSESLGYRRYYLGGEEYRFPYHEEFSKLQEDFQRKHPQAAADDE